MSDDGRELMGGNSAPSRDEGREIKGDERAPSRDEGRGIKGDERAPSRDEGCGVAGDESSPSRDEGRRFLAFLAGSAAVHLALILVPLTWWAMVPWVGGGGAEPRASAGAEPMTVSLVDLPADESRPEPLPAAPAAVVEPVEPSPEPELSPLPPEPEIPELPLPVTPSPPANLGPRSGAGEPGAVGEAGTPGEGTEGEPGEGVPGPGDPEPRYRPPRLLAGALPLTPEESEDLDLDVPLEIVVRLRVGQDGLVREVKPAEPNLPPRLVEALERSAHAMRFVPARLGDDPVEAWFSMTFVYRR